MPLIGTKQWAHQTRVIRPRYSRFWLVSALRLAIAFIAARGLQSLHSPPPLAFGYVQLSESWLSKTGRISNLTPSSKVMTTTWPSPKLSDVGYVFWIDRLTACRSADGPLDAKALYFAYSAYGRMNAMSKSLRPFAAVSRPYDP